jgi:hypothetical protein
MQAAAAWQIRKWHNGTFSILKRLLHRKIKQAGCVLLLQVGRLKVGKVLENSRKTLTIQILLPQKTIDYHHHTDTNTFHRSTSHHITTSHVQHLCPAVQLSSTSVVCVVLDWPLGLQWRSAAMA